MKNEDLTTRLKEHALNHGIDLIGITSAKPFAVQRKKKIINDPKELLPDAQSVIVTGFYINEIDQTLANEKNNPKGRYNSYDVKAYMPLEDYHIQIIQDFLVKEGYRVVSDKEHHFPAKAAAVRAGLGKYGKNSVVITKQYGSYIMFASMITNAALEFKELPLYETDCGNCTICMKSCPTGAIYEPFKINRSLCVTAWLWGDFAPMHLREKQQNRLFGCGECVKVCPKNKNLKPREKYPVELENVSDNPELIPLLTADIDYLNKNIASFPLCAGKEAILGNAIIAIGNSRIKESPILLSKLKKTIKHNNNQIKAYSAWTLGRIGGKKAMNILIEAQIAENNNKVFNELTHSIAYLKL